MEDFYTEQVAVVAKETEPRYLLGPIAKTPHAR